MSFLFSRNKIKTPQELIKLLSEQLDKLDLNGTNLSTSTTSTGTGSGNGADLKRNLDDISRSIVQIRLLLCGDQEVTPSPDQIGTLSQEVYGSDILIPLVSHLHALDFEARKDVVLIFTTLLRRQIGPHSPTVDYLITRPEIFRILIQENGNQEIALNVGTIVRDCCKHEQLNQMLLSSADVWKYFDYIGDYNFEVSTDAFVTLQDMLTLHPQTAAKFLVANSAKFTKHMTTLMAFNSNYVTKRQSLKLMAQLMRQRANYNFMTEYIDNVDNLKLIMGSLRDKSKNIQYEAFQIFKIFVANPKKSKPILDILVKNKIKLLNFLAVFHSDRDEDQAFKEEKEFIINEIQSLPNYSPSPSLPSQAPTNANPAGTTPNHNINASALDSAVPLNGRGPRPSGSVTPGKEQDSYTMPQMQAPQVIKPSIPIAGTSSPTAAATHANAASPDTAGLGGQPLPPIPPPRHRPSHAPNYVPKQH